MIVERLTWEPDASSSLECVTVSLFCVNLLNGGGAAKSPGAGPGSGVGGAGDFGLNAGCSGGRVRLRRTESRRDEAGSARNEALTRDCRCSCSIEIAVSVRGETNCTNLFRKSWNLAKDSECGLQEPRSD